MFSARLPDHLDAHVAGVINRTTEQRDMKDSRYHEEARHGASRSDARPRPQLIRGDAPRDHARSCASSLHARRDQDTIGRISPRFDPDPPRGDPPTAA